MLDILELHRRATTHHRIGYDERQRRYAALREAVAALVLPFRWHPVAMDNPTQNHTGYTNGRDHIVLDEPYKRGRLVREQGAALCGGDSANLWGEASSVTCKACLRMAARESAANPPAAPNDDFDEDLAEWDDMPNVWSLAANRRKRAALEAQS